MPESSEGLDLHRAMALESDLVAFRREMHANPEVGLHLPGTQGRVLEALNGLGLEIKTGDAATSVVAVLRGTLPLDAKSPRPSVLLRADMDGLPVSEDTGLNFAAKNGVMHACGHDMHTAGLVGAAKLLASVRDQIAGDVIFMFQPGEEGYDGARLMLNEGVLEASGSRPQAAYGLHMAPDSPAGLFTTRPGSYMAAFCELAVRIVGRGGHGSRPFEALDPIQVAAEIIGSLQTYITRRFSVFDPAVLTVGTFHAGTAINVIPDDAQFLAAIRCFSADVEQRLENELPRLVENIAEGHQLKAEATFTSKLPVVVNDPVEAEFWASTARDLFGVAKFKTLLNPKAGSEDFAYMLQEVPGSFGHLGAGSPDIDPKDWAPLHSSKAIFDDRILPEQALFLATLGKNKLQRVVLQAESAL